MLTQVRMPSLDATMEEGVIVSWRVREGDRIDVGDLLVDIESDKSVFEYECPCAGIVRRIVVEEGQTCPVQATIVLIGDGDEDLPDEHLTEGSAQGERPRASATAAPAAGESPSTSKATATAGPRISPRARKHAKELGVVF